MCYLILTTSADVKRDINKVLSVCELYTDHSNPTKNAKNYPQFKLWTRLVLGKIEKVEINFSSHEFEKIKRYYDKLFKKIYNFNSDRDFKKYNTT